jgi:hypothetical protein
VIYPCNAVLLHVRRKGILMWVAHGSAPRTRTEKADMV